MSAPAVSAPPPPAVPAGWAVRAEDFLALAKPRVATLICLVTAAGFTMGSPARVDLARLALTLLGTLLAAGGSLALNQLLERDLDAKMQRTVERPIVQGRIDPSTALAFGVGLVASGLALLTLLVDPVAGLVTAATVVLYVFAYTPLKRRSALCTVIGAVPGALPPVTGWAAATGGLGDGAWALFGIFFFWQLPHSLAIARLFRDDYAAAGIRVLPVTDRDGRSTGRQVLLHALALVAVGPLPTFVGIAGTAYAALSLVLGGLLLVLAVRFARDDSAAAARRLFLASLVYVPALLVAMAIDRVPR